MAGGLWRPTLLENQRQRARLNDQSMRILSSTVEQSQSGVIIADCTGVIDYVNPRYTQITGHSKDDAVGRVAELLNNEELTDVNNISLQEALLLGASWETFMVSKRKNGGHFWQQGTVSPIPDDLGALRHIVLNIEDISDRVETQAQMEKLAFYDPLTGLIIKVGEIVLRKACLQLKALQASGITDQAVAVNLSARQFRDRNLVQMICRVLSETSLELEITESMLMDNIDQTISIFSELKALGVAIDGFGTGYSSLSYLTQLPVDKLKLDRSFVANLPDSSCHTAITTAIIAMAQRLNLQVDFTIRGNTATTIYSGSNTLMHTFYPQAIHTKRACNPLHSTLSCVLSEKTTYILYFHGARTGLMTTSWRIRCKPIPQVMAAALPIPAQAPARMRIYPLPRRVSFALSSAMALSSPTTNPRS